MPFIVSSMSFVSLNPFGYQAGPMPLAVGEVLFD
jgi:hypothetical protein